MLCLQNQRKHSKDTITSNAEVTASELCGLQGESLNSGGKLLGEELGKPEAFSKDNIIPLAAIACEKPAEAHASPVHAQGGGKTLIQDAGIGGWRLGQPSCVNLCSGLGVGPGPPDLLAMRRRLKAILDMGQHVDRVLKAEAVSLRDVLVHASSNGDMWGSEEL